LKVFFDTSVLVAAFLGDHPHHRSSLEAFAAAKPSEAACGAQSLAELYAVVTRMPLRPIIGGDQALLFIEELTSRLAVITLNGNGYRAALSDAADRGITGGKVYDALLLRCADLSGAETIYTWNVRHFQAIAPHLAEKIRTPGS
jgi:predicted nucleic acid-binding protein